MKTEIGPYEIVYSGVVIPIENHPIEITLTDEVEGDYTIIMKFVEDSAYPDTITAFTQGANKFTLIINFTNFSAMSSGGNTELASIGTLKKSALHFNYRVISIGVGKTIFYNFLVKKGGKDGN